MTSRDWRRLLAGVAIAGAITVPTYLAITERTNANEAAEYSALRDAFVAQYGSAPWTQQPVKQSSLYVVYWKDDTQSHISALIGGVWVNLATTPLTPAGQKEGTP